jgi:hypothetical protein
MSSCESGQQHPKKQRRSINEARVSMTTDVTQDFYRVLAVCRGYACPVYFANELRGIAGKGRWLPCRLDRDSKFHTRFSEPRQRASQDSHRRREHEKAMATTWI